jgi:hypothetical protein
MLYDQNPTLGVCPKKMKSACWTDIHVHCSIIHNSREIETISVHQLINGKEKILYVYAMEYYPATKKNEILSFVAIWMDLEDIMLSCIAHLIKKR